MAFEIEYDPKAVKQLSKIDKQVASKILDGIEEHASNPESKKLTKLKTPFDGAYRLRMSDYRVIFYQENNFILISKVAHRKQVYS